MPPQHGVWLDDHQRRSPSAPHGGQQDPEDPVTVLEAGMSAGASQGMQLLPQSEVLHDHFVMLAAGERERSRDQ
jgi:hypothetical protein